MEFFLIYLYTVLDSLRILLLVWLLYILIVSTLTAIDPAGNIDPSAIKKALGHKTAIFLLVVGSFSTLFIPDNKELKTIIGGGLVWKTGKALNNTSGTKDLPENLINAMSSFLKSIDVKEGK
jgi:hypothetical protein